MANALLEFDPTSESASNSPLEIWSTTSYAVTAFSAPAPPLEVQWAGSIDTEGSLPASRKHQNRTLNITVEVMSAAALRSLQAKVGKVAREGGTLKLTLPASSEVVIFDLHAADTFDPQLDITYFVNSGAFCAVNLSLLAKPYGRGASATATLSAATATSKAPHVFTTTGVKGDMPALGTLTINNATATKTLLMWGLRSRYYDASSPLFYEAETLTASGATANAGYTGASGGGANKVMRHLNVGTSGNVAFTLSPSGSAHIGTYRVLARVQADSANTGIVSVRGKWYPLTSSGSIISGAWVDIKGATGTAIQGSWVIADLGLVTIPKARFGTQSWYAELEAKSTVSTDDLDWDWLALIPVDEGSGRLEIPSPTAVVAAAGAVVVADDTVQVKSGGSSTYYRGAYEGDYLLIPPAGAEARTLEMIAFLAGPPSNTSGNLTDTIADAVNIDATTATLTYLPRYLVVPEP